MASQRHCVLSISPGSVERLSLSQYAPIVILIDIDSRNRIRDLRNKSGASTLSARKLIEQASKLKKHHSHLFTGFYEYIKLKFNKKHKFVNYIKIYIHFLTQFLKFILKKYFSIYFFCLRFGIFRHCTGCVFYFTQVFFGHNF